jgi:hypothetical protein
MTVQLLMNSKEIHFSSEIIQLFNLQRKKVLHFKRALTMLFITQCLMTNIHF